MDYKHILAVVSKYYHIEENNHSQDLISDVRRISIEDIHKKAKKEIDRCQQLVNEIKSAFTDIREVKQFIHPVETCFTIILVITKKEIENITLTQELYIHFSFLAECFCIYGKDNVALIDNGLKSEFDPIITISPKNVYEYYFSELLLMIRRIRPNNHFLPYLLLKQRIVGLRIFSTFLKENQFSSIYQALFRSENLTDYKKTGDLQFFYNQETKE